MPLGELTVEHFTKADDEDVWLGTIYLFGHPMHFQAIKVEYDEKDHMYKATLDPYERLEEVYGLYYPDVPLQTQTIPGMRGEYVIVMFPHGG